MSNLETRDFEIRETDTEKRTVVGRAVPYNDPIDIGGGLQEKFAKGAVDLNSNVKLFRDHKDVIGKVTAMEERDDGLWITAKVSKTQLGEETLNLVNDGAIRSFSVGFIPVKDEKQDRTIVRTKVNLKEVSLVAFPAYENASVTEVREIKEEITMTETNNVDYSASIDEVRSHTEELERRLDVLATAKTPSAPETIKYRSFGEYVKAAAAGEEDAIKLHRDFTGGQLSDTILKPNWITDVARIINRGRPTYGVFQTGVMPATGNTLEYPLISSNTMDYQEQVAEGDELAYGKIALESATAPIKTFGGWTNMSRQVIERSTINYVDHAFRAMAAVYAKQTNKYIQDSLVANAGSFQTATLNSFNTADVLDLVTDCAAKVNYEMGKALDFILVSTDVYKQFAKVTDGYNRPILGAMNPMVDPTFGSVNPTGLTGSILGLPIVLDPSLPDGTIYVGNAEALITYESAGAPFRLTLDDITHLTRSFSVYGYNAVALPYAKSLVKVTID